MNNEEVLNKLQKNNDSLKSKLIGCQLKEGNYSFEYFNKYSLEIINEYKKSKSLFKASQKVGISYTIVMEWYIQGNLGNSLFRGFYLVIAKLKEKGDVMPEAQKDFENPVESSSSGDNTYEVSQYGDGWSYKTFVGGEKIFIISNDLEGLKKKVRDRNLPID